MQKISFMALEVDLKVLPASSWACVCPQIRVWESQVYLWLELLSKTLSWGRRERNYPNYSFLQGIKWKHLEKKISKKPGWEEIVWCVNDQSVIGTCFVHVFYATGDPLHCSQVILRVLWIPWLFETLFFRFWHSEIVFVWPFRYKVFDVQTLVFRGWVRRGDSYEF